MCRYSTAGWGFMIGSKVAWLVSPWGKVRSPPRKARRKQRAARRRAVPGAAAAVPSHLTPGLHPSPPPHPARHCPLPTTADPGDPQLCHPSHLAPILRHAGPAVPRVPPRQRRPHGPLPAPLLQPGPGLPTAPARRQAHALCGLALRRRLLRVQRLHAGEWARGLGDVPGLLEGQAGWGRGSCAEMAGYS